jgi:sarcosine/dimethylglycine N-methyltransferase
MSEGAVSVAVQTEAYYDSDAADSFYSEIWGGNDIHIGIYGHGSDSVRAASSRTVATMATRLSDLGHDIRALDLGAGYGGAARYLAALYECRVDCLNLSQVQNETNRRMCEEAGLAARVRVVHGSFESIPADEDAYDVVWSQDAILHSGARERVLAEIARVSAPGAQLVFIHLDSLASPGFYRKNLQALGFEELSWTPMPEQLRRHYATVAAELDARREEMRERCGDEYVARMREGLQHWVDAADRGHLTWGIFHFRRP